MRSALPSVRVHLVDTVRTRTLHPAAGIGRE
jgi:hypothetical protein